MMKTKKTIPWFGKITGNGFGAKAGFSLVELVVVLGIMAVALMVATPAYLTTIKPTAELKGAASRLFGDIQSARLRAVKDNASIGIAFSTNPDSYTVFMDNSPANGQYDTGEQIIKTVTFSQDYGNVRFDAACGACGGDGITFAGNAFSITPRALASGGGVVFLKNQNNEGRSVVVSQTGSVRIEEYTP